MKERLIKFVLDHRANLPRASIPVLKQSRFHQDPLVSCANYWSFRITGDLTSDYWGGRISDAYTDRHCTGEWALEFHDRGGHQTNLILKQRCAVTGDWLVTDQIHYTRHFGKWFRRQVRSIWC